MNIHEYQAKELLQRFNVATTRGKVASTLEETEQIARELGDVEIVVKAQVHAGEPVVEQPMTPRPRELWGESVEWPEAWRKPPR